MESRTGMGQETVDEAKWLEGEHKRLRRQCELAETGWVGFVFCPTMDAATDMRELVEGIGRARDEQRGQEPGTSSVLVIRPREPDELRHLVIRLFEPGTASAWCVWVDAMDVDCVRTEDGKLEPTEPWRAAWFWLMMRTNEVRDRLRRHMNGGLVFSVRNAWKPPARDAAPDLWSIRSIVVETPKPRERRLGGTTGRARNGRRAAGESRDAARAGEATHRARAGRDRRAATGRRPRKAGNGASRHR